MYVFVGQSTSTVESDWQLCYCVSRSVCVCVCTQTEVKIKGTGRQRVCDNTAISLNKCLSFSTDTLPITRTVEHIYTLPWFFSVFFYCIPSFPLHFTPFISLTAIFFSLLQSDVSNTHCHYWAKSLFLSFCQSQCTCAVHVHITCFAIDYTLGSLHQ